MAALSLARKSRLRIFGEGFTIVLSILLAFFIDAWWDERREEEDTQTMLVAVLDDLRKSKRRVFYDRTTSDTRMNAIVQLLAMSMDNDIDLRSHELEGLLGDLYWYQAEYVIADAGINSLIYSGVFGSINSEELRRDLAGWPTNKEYMLSVFDTHKQFLDNVWWPFMRNNGYHAQVLKRSTYRLGHPRSLLINPDTVARFPIESVDLFDHKTLLNNKEFQNVLAQYWSIQVDISIVYNNADKWLDQSIRRLEEELEIAPQPGTILFDLDLRKKD